MNYHLPFLFSERDAIDVENANDYCEMVANLAKYEPDKIKILVDMKAIRSSCKRVVSLLKHHFRKYLTLKFVNREMPVRTKLIHQLMKARYSTSSQDKPAFLISTHYHR
jgi:hypothetical protein